MAEREGGRYDAGGMVAQMNARPSDLIFPRHKIVARMVGMVLRLHERVSYAVLSRGLVEHLQPAEIHGLAWAALYACEPEKAWAIARDRLEGHEGVGPQEAPFWWWDWDPASIMDESMSWARHASAFQRRAMAMACLAHMTEEERLAIVRGLEGRSK